MRRKIIWTDNFGSGGEGGNGQKRDRERERRKSEEREKYGNLGIERELS